MRYRKKPVVVEAWQNTANPAVKPDWLTAAIASGSVTNGLQLTIQTLEGLMTACENDWIIRGVRGELYPCKPDIFAATYEAAE